LPANLKLRNKYTFPITEKVTCKQFIKEIKEEFHIPEPHPIQYANINYTYKLELPEDFKKVEEIGLVIPITDTKIL
ncbi:30103_t:CDS:1, partial [Gigaspora margarita]